MASNAKRSRQATATIVAAVVTAVAVIIVALINLYPPFSDEPREFQYTGRVEDAEGGPLSAKLELFVGDDAARVYETDNNGYFQFSLRQRDSDVQARLTATASGHKDNNEHLTLSPADLIVVSLERVEDVAKETSPLSTQRSPTVSGHNIFLEPRSPRIWFHQAKFYRRADTDSRRLKQDFYSGPIIVTRRYFSADSDREGVFGRGWTYQFDSRIDVEGSKIGRIVYWDEAGTTVEFEPTSDAYLEEIKQFLPDASLQTPLATVFEAERTEQSPYFLSSFKDLTYIGVRLDVVQLSFLREYIRIRLADNTVYLFDREGRLKFIKALTQPTVELRYDPVVPSRIARASTVTDPLYYVDLDYDEAGRISKVSYEDGTSYRYEYDQTNRLRIVRVGEEPVFQYDYRDSGHLTYVKEPNKLNPLRIEYNEAGWRVELERGERKIEWDIFDHPTGPKVVSRSFLGPLKEYETTFVFDEISQELRMREADSVVWKVYHLTSCGCKPLDVTKGNETTRYKYDDIGNLERVESPDELFEYEWDRRFNKVRLVTRRPEAGQAPTYEGRYEYDDEGRLFLATELSGVEIRLFYDDRNLISSMAVYGLGGAEERGELEFTYNALGKPDTVTVPHIGKAIITYDRDGNVLHVDGDKHREVLSYAQSVMRVLEGAYDFPIDTDFTKISRTL